MKIAEPYYKPFSNLILQIFSILGHFRKFADEIFYRNIIRK